jgi:hypothetical protein
MLSFAVSTTKLAGRRLACPRSRAPRLCAPAQLFFSLCVVAASTMNSEESHLHDAEIMPLPSLKIYVDGVESLTGADAPHAIAVPADGEVLVEWETLSFDPASVEQLALLVLNNGTDVQRFEPVHAVGEVVFPHAFGPGTRTLSLALLDAASGEWRFGRTPGASARGARSQAPLPASVPVPLVPQNAARPSSRPASPQGPPSRQQTQCWQPRPQRTPRPAAATVAAVARPRTRCDGSRRAPRPRARPRAASRSAPGRAPKMTTSLRRAPRPLARAHASARARARQAALSGGAAQVLRHYECRLTMTAHGCADGAGGGAGAGSPPLRVIVSRPLHAFAGNVHPASSPPPRGLPRPQLRSADPAGAAGDPAAPRGQVRQVGAGHPAAPPPARGGRAPRAGGALLYRGAALVRGGARGRRARHMGRAVRVRGGRRRRGRPGRARGARVGRAIGAIAGEQRPGRAVCAADRARGGSGGRRRRRFRDAGRRVFRAAGARVGRGGVRLAGRGGASAPDRGVAPRARARAAQGRGWRPGRRAVPGGDARTGGGALGALYSLERAGPGLPGLAHGTPAPLSPTPYCSPYRSP